MKIVDSFHLSALRARAALGVIVVISIIGWRSAGAWADTPVAPLNGTASFTNGNSPTDTLEVNAGAATIKATSAQMLQGDPNSTVTVISTPGSGVVQVATVLNRNGDSYYFVQGQYAGGGGGGGGGPAVTWTSGYNDGGVRIVLSLSTATIAEGANGAQLTVSIAGGDSATNYPVTLSLESITGDNGVVTFSTNPVTVNGAGSQVISLTGTTAGQLVIQGTTTVSGVTAGTASGQVN